MATLTTNNHISDEAKINGLCGVFSQGVEQVKYYMSTYEIPNDFIKENYRRVFPSICDGGKVSVFKYFIEELLNRKYIEEDHGFNYFIQYCIGCNRLNFIKHLVTQQNIFIPDRRYRMLQGYGAGPFLTAVVNNRLAIIKFFIAKYGYIVNGGIISYACKNCDLRTVKYLLDQVPLTQRCLMIHENDELALRNACDGLNFGVIKHLVSEYNVDIRVNNDEPFKRVIQSRIFDRRRVMYSSKRLKIVKYLIKKSNGEIDIRARNDWVFHHSISIGELCVVKYCIQQGANVRSNNDSALIKAASMGHILIVMYLIQQGANPHARGGEVLFVAAHYGYIDIVELLVESCEMDVSHFTEGMLQMIGQDDPELEQYIRTKKERTDVPDWATSDTSNKKTMNCAICIETVSNIIAFEPCGHVLCKDCCYNMYKRGDDKCPFCRVDIKKRKRYSDILDKTKLFI